ncbi:MAG TPA: Tol-Pal system beta propeller repeat protein TolB [Candidatus Binatia bacterium]|nr:Tol-Pal system beta propeller repeat protein TolB [Candidatus Binatia bacterium]
MRARFVLLVLALGLVAGPAGAVVTGAIYGPGSESFRIAVSPLKDLGGGGGLGAEFARALSRDLELSGYFKLIDPKTFVENPETSGITADAIDFTGWAALGAQALVKGGVSAQGGGVTVEVRLFDVPGRKDVPQVGKRFTGGRADVPRMAHKTADAILAYLTGEPGPFDSEIAFVSNRGGRLKDVYLLTFDRDEPVRLTDERSIVGAPEWRPDGRAILFRSYREHFPYLYEIDLASRQVRKLVPGTVPVLNGAWSPDGSRLLVTRDRGGDSNIDLLDRAGHLLRHVTDHWAIDVSPSWSPDGQHFVFCSSRTGSPQIYVSDVDGGPLRRLSATGSYNTSPVWSPKGDHIAYTTRAGGAFQVVVVDADGADPHTITSAGSNEDPTWSPDGRYLIFSSTRAGRHHLVMADRDGRSQHELTRGAADDTSPAWSPRRE